MSNYTQNVSYAPKDALTPGDPSKVILGSQIDAELSEISTAIASKEDSANKAQPNGYAPLNGSSLLADSYLTTNIPRLASSAVFTGPLFSVESAQPDFRLRETDGATDEQYWIWLYSAGTLYLRAYNDALVASNPAITIERTGTTVDSIALASTALTWNGNTLFTTANDGAGSGLDADLLDAQSSAFYRDATNLNAGTVPDARFPATLPAVSGVNLTALPATLTPTTIELGHASDTTFARIAAGRASIEGLEIGYRSLPSGSVTTGAFAAADNGKSIYATAGVTIPNSVMAANDVVVIQNTTGAGITITRSITTAYNTATGATLGATFTLGARGRCSIVFTSSTECYVSGNIS